MSKWTIIGIEKYTDRPAPVFVTKKQAEDFVQALAFVRARDIIAVKVEEKQ